MFKNFITDTDLQVLYPTLTNKLWANQETYAPQISKASDIVQVDLFNAGVKTEYVMTPIDLKTTETSQTLIPPKISTESANTTGPVRRQYANERRFVIQLNAPVTGSWTVALYGSNASSEPAVGDGSWELIDTLEINTDPSVLLNTTVIDAPYRWYYYQSAVQGSGTISGQYFMVDTSFDDCIVYAALSLIFTDFLKENTENDAWNTRRLLADKQYANVLSKAKFGYDKEMKGKLDDDSEDTTRFINITFAR
jgi:hypothetical protein